MTPPPTANGREPLDLSGVSDPIDRILIQFYNDHFWSNTLAITDKEKAKQAIDAYVAQAERKARLTELEVMNRHFDDWFAYSPDDYHKYLEDRLKELERKSDEKTS